VQWSTQQDRTWAAAGVALRTTVVLPLQCSGRALSHAWPRTGAGAADRAPACSCAQLASCEHTDIQPNARLAGTSVTCSAAHAVHLCRAAGPLCARCRNHVKGPARARARAHTRPTARPHQSATAHALQNSVAPSAGWGLSARRAHAWPGAPCCDAARNARPRLAGWLASVDRQVWCVCFRGVAARCGLRRCTETECRGPRLQMYDG
jgi:hypothetical protein